MQFDKLVEHLLESNHDYTISKGSGGGIYYRLNGMLHREDGPAIEWPDGDGCWMQHGLYHREDGPAMIMGSEERYWINGKELTKNEFDEFVRNKQFKQEMLQKDDNMFDKDFLDGI